MYQKRCTKTSDELSSFAGNPDITPQHSARHGVAGAAGQVFDWSNSQCLFGFANNAVPSFRKAMRRRLPARSAKTSGSS
jgi:hypothetical protein